MFQDVRGLFAAEDVGAADLNTVPHFVFCPLYKTCRFCCTISSVNSSRTVLLLDKEMAKGIATFRSISLACLFNLTCKLAVFADLLIECVTS